MSVFVLKVQDGQGLYDVLSHTPQGESNRIIGTAMYGKTAGGVWVPLTVDSDGRLSMAGAAPAGSAAAGNPVLVGGSDGANARTLRVDSSGRPEVTLSGSLFKLEMVQIIPRGVYQLSQSVSNWTVPSGTRNIWFQAIIHGVTGSFTSGQGLGLTITPLPSGVSLIGNFGNRLQTARTTQARSNESVKQPGCLMGLDINDAGAEGTDLFLQRKMVVVSPLRIIMNINGTFNANEGFDAELVAWCYKLAL